MTNPFIDHCPTEQIFITKVRLACAKEDGHALVKINGKIADDEFIYFETNYLDGQIEFDGALSFGKEISMGIYSSLDVSATLSFSGIKLNHYNYLLWLAHKNIVAEFTHSDGTTVTISPLQLKLEFQNETNGFVATLSFQPSHFTKCNGCITPTNFIINHTC